ncbi:hypothetical protein, partial [Mycolicibacterium confluentis]|uniref:hypothetical protein n=1 Tax=Mycolicibacterium confluentis TaxID=28047 RepID=UPI001A9835DE
HSPRLVDHHACTHADPKSTTPRGTIDPRTGDRLAFNTFVPTVPSKPGFIDRLISFQIVRSSFAAVELAVRPPVADVVY